MRRLNVLIWHIHGSYLNTLARIDPNWHLPTKPDQPESTAGRGPPVRPPPARGERPAGRAERWLVDAPGRAAER